MNINQLLHTHLYQAIKENDVTRKRTLRLLMASLKLAEVAKGSELVEEEILGIVQKEIKIKHDTIADAERAGRQDLINEAHEEIKLLEGYLPKQITQEELRALAQQVVEEVGASSINDMGKVIKTLVNRLAGRATNQDASRVVRDILHNKS